LTNLEKLELSENWLTDLPASIANLADTLQQLDLRGNPIPVERRAAIQAMLPNTTISWE
jgi:Leucine-rich repeat (LRR) protein